jgi:membrane-associated phospholipid phosphatase
MCDQKIRAIKIMAKKAPVKCVSMLAILLVSFPAYPSNKDVWKTTSNIGAYGLVGAALAVPLFKDDREGFIQASYSMVTATGVGLLGKSLIDEERPDKSGNDSFPSNHTANSFAAATTLNLRYGWKLGVPAYGVATLVAVGRVQAQKHYWKDVLGGAAIGLVSGWVFTDAYNENVKVFPWADINEAGIKVELNW